MKNQSIKRQKIIHAAKELLLEVGYESMSPRKVLDRSGAGQGSLYHHFSGKKQLARTVLDDVSAELKVTFDEIFKDQELSPLEKIDKYLARERRGMQGCKLGRLSNEKAFVDDELRQPLQSFFTYILAEVSKQLQKAVDDGSFPLNTPTKDIAHLIVASIQGGYVISKSINHGEAVIFSTQGARALLKAYEI